MSRKLLSSLRRADLNFSRPVHKSRNFENDYVTFTLLKAFLDILSDATNGSNVQVVMARRTKLWLSDDVDALTLLASLQV